jgi:hypothetical protein
LYRFNPQAKVQWLELGQSCSRALLIDDALLDLSQIRRDAAAAQFRQDPGSYYPGVRAELPQAYARSVLEAVYPLLLQLVQPPPDHRLVPQQWYLSLLTTPAAQLQPLQRLPHFDKADPLHLAILHYLAEGTHGGTGFFRHEATGFEKIMPARQQQYFSTLQQQLTAQGGAAPGFPGAATPHFNLYRQLAYQPNRLLIYPGHLLHSALVEPATDLSADPGLGRLTANLFVQFQPKSSL